MRRGEALLDFVSDNVDEGVPPFGPHGLGNSLERKAKESRHREDGNPSRPIEPVESPTLRRRFQKSRAMNYREDHHPLSDDPVEDAVALGDDLSNSC